MNIDRLDVYHVAMPLIYPWKTAYGEDTEIHSVLVKAVSGEYQVWSEASPLYAPTYLPESAGSVFYTVTQFLAPSVVGREFDTADDLNSQFNVIKGNSFAKAAVEICWWLLHSAITGIPLHKLLGGRTRQVDAGADFGVQDSLDMLLANIQKAVDAGFPRVKLKVRKGWDLEVLRVACETFPNMTFHPDFNAGYTLDDLPFFKAIDSLGLAFLEQPLHYSDVLDHADLARQIETPICLDESIVSVKAAEQAINVGACKYINIKPGRVGGLSNAIAIHNLAKENGIPVWVGGMLESAVGASICVDLATLDNFTYPGDLFPSSRFYKQDLGVPPLEITPRNTFDPIGMNRPQPDPDALARQTVQYKSVVPLPS